MGALHIGFAVAAAVVLFLFGIEHFSREVQSLAGARFRRFMARGTDNRFAGFALGAAVTAVIQSSTATSVIAVGLVNAGVITFRQSVAVIFGANVGTTVTAQLVALKLTDFAPALILFGFVAGLMPFRWRILGRSIFYFGLVFFSLQLVSAAVEPLKTDPTLLAWLSSFDSAIIGVLVGAVFTGIVQSSSVTTGVAIILMSQGALTLGAALPLILGANVGTTVTSLLAAARLDASARRTAASHAIYNVLGALLFLPLLGLLELGLLSAGLDGAIGLATAHLIFNLVTALLFLALLEPFVRLIERLIPDESDEETPVRPLLAEDFAVELESRRAVRRWASEVVALLSRGYTMAVLALETRDAAIDNGAKRLAGLVDYALEEATMLVRELAHGEISEARSEAILHFVVTIDHARQLQDSLEDLRGVGERLDRHNARLSIDALLEVQAVFPIFAKMLNTLSEALDEETDTAAEARLEDALRQAHRQLVSSYRGFLDLVRAAGEGGELADFLSIHQRVRTKVAAFATFLETETPGPPVESP